MTATLPETLAPPRSPGLLNRGIAWAIRLKTRQHFDRRIARRLEPVFSMDVNAQLNGERVSFNEQSALTNGLALGFTSMTTEVHGVAQHLLAVTREQADAIVASIHDQFVSSTDKIANSHKRLADLRLSLDGLTGNDQSLPSPASLTRIQQQSEEDVELGRFAREHSHLLAKGIGLLAFGLTVSGLELDLNNSALRSAFEGVAGVSDWMMLTQALSGTIVMTSLAHVVLSSVAGVWKCVAGAVLAAIGLGFGVLRAGVLAYDGSDVLVDPGAGMVPWTMTILVFLVGVSLALVGARTIHEGMKHLKQAHESRADSESTKAEIAVAVRKAAAAQKDRYEEQHRRRRSRLLPRLRRDIARLEAVIPREERRRTRLLRKALGQGFAQLTPEIGHAARLLAVWYHGRSIRRERS